MLRLLDWLPDDSDAWPRMCGALRDLKAVAEQIWTSFFREAGCGYDIAASSRRIFLSSSAYWTVGLEDVKETPGHPVYYGIGGTRKNLYAWVAVVYYLDNGISMYIHDYLEMLCVRATARIRLSCVYHTFQGYPLPLSVYTVQYQKLQTPRTRVGI